LDSGIRSRGFAGGAKEGRDRLAEAEMRRWVLLLA